LAAQRQAIRALSFRADRARAHAHATTADASAQQLRPPGAS